MTPLEQIKAEVVKCCPEIMELENGCLIKGGGMIWNGWANFGDERTDNLDFTESEILGSPIELHHILRTIESKCREIERMHGTNEAVYDMQMDVIQNYNLALPLASQSEPTLKGIAELLSKK